MKKSIVAVSIVMLAAGSLLVTSCSKKPSTNDNGYVSTGQNSGVQTYGATSSDGFQTNSMNAPSNQTYYFGFDQSSLKSSDMQALLVQANYLAAHATARVRVEGNTDNRGSREYNVGLGWRRDQTVARVLEQQGVRPSQIQMVSYGKENPAVSGNDEHAWALNRRVNFVYKG